jgi:iron complex outermembrane receptor protein
MSAATLSKIDGHCCVATVRSVVPGSPLATSLAAAGIVPGPRNLEVNLDAGAFSRSTNAGASVEVTWRLGEHELTSLTAWRTWAAARKHRQRQHAAAGPQHNFGRSDLDQFTQELRLASPTGGRLEYVVGFYYFDAELLGNNGQLGSLSLTSATPVLEPLLRRHQPDRKPRGVRPGDVPRHRQAAPDPGRALHARRRFDGFRALVLSRDHAVLAAADAASLDLGLEPLRTRGLQYDFEPERHGLRDRVARLQGTRLQRPPERDDHREHAGAAGNPDQLRSGPQVAFFDRRLTLNLAALRHPLQGLPGQFNDPTIPPLGAFVVGNAARLRTRGAELEFAAQPDPGAQRCPGA